MAGGSGRGERETGKAQWKLVDDFFSSLAIGSNSGVVLPFRAFLFHVCGCYIESVCMRQRTLPGTPQPLRL